MSITFRNYVNDQRFGKDYHLVWEFLNRINQQKVTTPNFLPARWVWLMSRPVEHEELKNKIGLWEDAGKIVALATFELTFGEVFVCIDSNYYHLVEEIISYAKEYLSDEGHLKIIINDNNKNFQMIAAKCGFRPTQKKENIAILDTTDDLDYELPEGFYVVSMADNWDFYQYNRVMWRGFNHEGEPSQTDEDIDWRKTMLSSPHLNPELIVSIAAPNGDYVSHCGLWHSSNQHYAYVEPVATDPSYRKLGLAKAAIYETIQRAKKQGAKEAYVGSSQQFYYNIGFKPSYTETWWELISNNVL